MRDCSQLMNIPLEGYRTFIDDFVELIGEMPELMRHARGTVEADTISLHMDVDDQLIKRITKQVRGCQVVAFSADTESMSVPAATL